MSERDFGFLYKDERKLIDAYATLDYDVDGNGEIDKDSLPQASPDERRDAMLAEIDERKVKSRLRNGVAGRQGLRELLHEIKEDLMRVHRFHSVVLDQPGGEWAFEDHTLPRVEDDIDNLLCLLQHWKGKAQDDRGEGIREQLSEHLSVFHEDLTEKQRIYDGETNIDESKKADELDELEARRTALVALLKDEQLREMLQFVADHENEKRDEYKKRQNGKNNWAWWISHQLAGEHGIITRGVWSNHCYELTDRGERVHRVLNGLENVPAVEAGSERGESWERYVLLLLRTHHPGYEKLATT